MQGRLPLLTRLRRRNWPSWMQPEQLRMCPGMFYLANHVFYNNTIKIGSHLKVANFPISIAFERWCSTLNSSGMANTTASTTMKPSPSGEVLPIFIDGSNSFCYRESNGTSKGNADFVNLTCHYLDSFKDYCEKNQVVLKNEDIAIVVPYLKHARSP